MNTMRKLVASLCVLILASFMTTAMAEGGSFVFPNVITSPDEIVTLGLGGNHYSEKVGGGYWDYGTSFILPFSKQVYSNYYHASLWHRSSCRIGSEWSRSLYEAGGSTTRSTKTGSANAETQAFWSLETDPAWSPFDSNK